MLRVFTENSIHRINLFATEHWHRDTSFTVAAGMRVITEGSHGPRGDFFNFIHFLDAVRGMASSRHAMRELDLIVSVFDRDLVTFQSALERGSADRVPQCAQRDAIAAVYTIMNGEQRERFDITSWYIEQIEKAIYGEDDSIYVSSDSGTDDMPLLEGENEARDEGEPEQDVTEVIPDSGLQWGIRSGRRV
ncbi:hypothetical protein JR316_0006488 [Psilocybe cubensis]|uniref:Uncharacterized protein n=2 Tax=Psilocybe cubensis TaxID=181762 RepID=A0A8H7XMB5_PSICU|nr:hypothetical protein JR316_0006488 [Psilocybe cubensis]KAH9481958.1 hypothetical protein JR316_0006488 [Psilocybe cubensis]